MLSFLCLAAQIFMRTTGSTKCCFHYTIFNQYYSSPLRNAFLSSRKLLRFWDIINKSSKLFGAWVLETQMAQPCGKLTAICLLMLFPHPLQNRVPRVRILLPLPKKPGTSRSFGLFFFLSISQNRLVYHLSIRHVSLHAVF